MHLGYRDNDCRLLLIARSRRVGWIHGALIAVVGVLSAYCYAAPGPAAYAFTAAVAAYLLFDVAGRLSDETVVRGDPVRHSVIVRTVYYGRVTASVEHALDAVGEFSVERRDRWGGRIVLRLHDGSAIPLEQRFAENVDASQLERANEALGSFRGMR